MNNKRKNPFDELNRSMGGPDTQEHEHKHMHIHTESTGLIKKTKLSKEINESTTPIIKLYKLFYPNYSNY